MNIEMPIIINRIFVGRSILSFNKFISIRGICVLRCSRTKINNYIIDITENNIIKLEFIVLLLLLLKSTEFEFPNNVIEIRKEDIAVVKAIAPLISIFFLNGTVLLLLSSCSLTWIIRIIVNVRISARGAIDIKVERQPKYSIVVAPKDKPITPPAANIDVRIPWAIDNLFSGNFHE